MKFCPECGSLLNPEDKICPCCKYDVVNMKKTEETENNELTLNPYNIKGIYVSTPSFGMLDPIVSLKSYIENAIMVEQDSDDEVAQKIENFSRGYAQDPMVKLSAATIAKKDLNKIMQEVKLIQKETDESKEYSTKYKEPYEETIGIIWSGILKEQSEEKAIEEIQNDVNDILNENIKLSEREQITKYINMLKKRDLNKIAKVANDKIQSFRIYTA